jgi:hypothetical protein
LVRPNGGGIEDRAGFINFDGQLFEEPFPEPGVRPALVPVVHGLPGSETFRQVSPGNARLGPPNDGIDELPVPSLGERTGSDREERLNALPLFIGQFVSVHGEC